MIKRVSQLFKPKKLLVFFTVVSITALLLSYLSVFVHPKTFSLFPIFGLTYWMIFLANLACLIAWALMKSRWAFVVLASIAFGGRLHFRNFCFGSDQANEKKSTEFKFLSYNLRLFDIYNEDEKAGQSNRKQIIEYLKRKNADVYCFQEFYHCDTREDERLKEILSDTLSASYVHSRMVRDDQRKREFGVVMMSKYKMIRKGEVSFGEIHKTNNFCIYADIVKFKDTLRVYNVHLQSIQLIQEDFNLVDTEGYSVQTSLFSKLLDAYPVLAEQAKRVAQHIESSPYPVVLCGDFNDTPMSYTYNQFNRNLIDAYRNTSFGIGSTYTGKLPAGRIDYIFHSESLGSRNFVIQEKELSDHYAISCKIFKE